MIVWLNGAFGGGKTTTTALLRARCDGSVIADPESIGDLLRTTLNQHPSRRRDYQDYRMWRVLVAALCLELDRYTHGGPVIVPMTLLRQDYATDIFQQLETADIEVRHLLLHADSATIADRIRSSMEFPGSEEKSEQVRQFRRRKLPDYVQAYGAWLHGGAEVIDTSGLNPDQVSARALDLLRSS